MEGTWPTWLPFLVSQHHLRLWKMFAFGQGNSSPLTGEHEVPVPLRGRTACRWKQLLRSAMSCPGHRKPNGTEHSLIFWESHAASLRFYSQSGFPSGSPLRAVRNSHLRGSSEKAGSSRQGAGRRAASPQVRLLRDPRVAPTSLHR